MKKNDITIASRKIEVSRNDKEEIIPFVDENFVIENSTKSPPAVLENIDDIGFDKVIEQTIKPKRKKTKSKEEK